MCLCVCFHLVSANRIWFWYRLIIYECWEWHKLCKDMWMTDDSSLSYPRRSGYLCGLLSGCLSLPHPDQTVQEWIQDSHAGMELSWKLYNVHCVLLSTRHYPLLWLLSIHTWLSILHSNKLCQENVGINTLNCVIISSIKDNLRYSYAFRIFLECVLFLVWQHPFHLLSYCWWYR